MRPFGGDTCRALYNYMQKNCTRSRVPIWNRVLPISGGRMNDNNLKYVWKTDMLLFILLRLKIFKHVAFYLIFNQSRWIEKLSQSQST